MAEATGTVTLDDDALATAATGGDRAALESLLKRYHAWIYNLAVRMVYSRADAEDATQEILLKVATRLGSFRGESTVRTWVYRVAVNHLLSRRRGRVEEIIHGFDCYGRELDAMADEDEPGPEEEVLIREAKIGCTVGMLLCLDREQRMAFVLGEIFGATDAEGADALGITRDGFRQRLSRARHQLQEFLKGRCGLSDPENPCRCARKTRAFVRAGVVDPNRLEFAAAYRARVEEVAPARADALDCAAAVGRPFREHPFFEPADISAALAPLLEDPAPSASRGCESPG